MTTFTSVHVVLSLVGILGGLVVLYGLLTANRMSGWTLVFLLATGATSLTGFGFGFAFHGCVLRHRRSRGRPRAPSESY